MCKFSFVLTGPQGTSLASSGSLKKREAKLMKRSWELTSIIVVAAIAVLMLIAFLWINGGFGTAPETSPGGEHPATRAPAGVEPPEPNTPAAEPQ
jgi:hypothetical protein